MGDLWDLGHPHDLRQPVRRRRRRLVLVGVAAVVLATAAVVGAPLWPTSAPSPEGGGAPLGSFFVMPASAADNPNCLTDPLAPGTSRQSIGSADLQSTPELAAASYLVGGVTPESLTIRGETYPCGVALASAVFYDPAGTGGISLYADVADPFTRVSTGTTPVRGTEAHVLTPPAGHHFVTWTEPDGIRWYVVARGMTVAQLASWLDTAPLAGVSVGPDASVPGMVRTPDLAHAPEGPSTLWAWDATYAGLSTARVEKGYSDTPAGAVTLRVLVGPQDDLTARLSWAIQDRVLTTVDGVPATYTPHSEGGSLLVWSKDGATFQLFVGAHTLEASQAVAAQLEHVALDDPRVTSRLTP